MNIPFEYAILIGLFLTVAILILFMINEFLAFFILLGCRLTVNLSEYSTGIYGINASSFFGITVILYALIIVFIKQGNKLSIPMFWPYYLFLVVSIFSYLNSGKTLGFIAQFFKLVAMPCLFLISYNLIKTLAQGKKALRYFVFLSFVPMLIGFYQLVTGGGIIAHVHLDTSFHKIMSTFTNPNGYSFFLGLIIFSVFVLIQERNKTPFTYYLFLGSALISLLLTYSRSVWLSVTICSIIILSHSKKLWIPIISFVLIIFFAFSSVIVSRFADLVPSNQKYATYDQTNSLEFRILMTKSLFEKAFPIHPFIGFGLGSSVDVATKYAKMSTFPHNDYMRVLIETGLLGLSCFITFIIGNFVFLLRNIKLYGKNPYFSGLVAIIIYFSGIIIGTNQISVIPTGGMWFCLYGILLKLYQLSLSEPEYKNVM